MDYFGATSKLFSVYEKLKTMNIPNNELGLFEHRYKVDGNLAFLVAVVTKPIKEKTGKKKVFDKVINKSKDKKRPILPKYFKYIRLYLSGIFSQISSGRDEVLQRIKEILTGFRLRFYLKNNLKYVFLDNKNPEILINQGTSSRGQYYCFIHIFRLKEEGLILAHERQIKYIQQEIEKGKNPKKIKNLPPLRTGNTYFQKRKKDEEEEKEEDQPSTAVKKFKQKVKKKQNQKEINKELDFETVIESHSKEEGKKKLPQQNKVERPVGLFGTPIKGKKQQKKKESQENKKTIDFQTKRVQKSPSIMHLENEVEELEQKIADLEHQKQASESLNLMLKNKIENLEKENLKYQDQLKGLTQDLTEKLEDREREIGALSQFKKANQVLTQNITKLSEENEDLKDKISYLQNEKIRLKDELSEQKNISMKEMKKMDNTIERLIQQKRRLEEQVNILKDKAGKYNKEQIKEIFQENQVLAKAIKERDQSYNSLLEDYKNLIEEKEREMKEKNKYDLEIEKRIKQLEKENKKLRKKIKENSIKEEI